MYFWTSCHCGTLIIKCNIWRVDVQWCTYTYTIYILNHYNSNEKRHHWNFVQIQIPWGCLKWLGSIQIASNVGALVASCRWDVLGWPWVSFVDSVPWSTTVRITVSNIPCSIFTSLMVGPQHCMARLAGWVPKNSNLTQVPQLQHLRLGLSFKGQGEGGISGYGWLKSDESTELTGSLMAYSWRCRCLAS